jgi:hypothetical protein
MSHFAELDENNKVIRVVVCDNAAPNEGLDWLQETMPGNWVKTSYNANIRKNFAGIGFTYDEVLDAFIAPKPFDSWSLNTETAQWEAPTSYPSDGLIYHWNEAALDWEAVIYDNAPAE